MRTPWGLELVGPKREELRSPLYRGGSSQAEAPVPWRGLGFWPSGRSAVRPWACLLSVSLPWRTGAAVCSSAGPRCSSSHNGPQPGGVAGLPQALAKASGRGHPTSHQLLAPAHPVPRCLPVGRVLGSAGWEGPGQPGTGVWAAFVGRWPFQGWADVWS